MGTFEQERDAVLKEMRAFSGKDKSGLAWFITINKTKPQQQLIVDFVYSSVLKPLIQFPTEQAAYDCISSVGAKRIKDYYFSFEKPKKTGFWIRLEDSHQDRFICSECNEEPWWCGVDEAVLPPYCPMCGAEMDCEVR